MDEGRYKIAEEVSIEAKVVPDSLTPLSGLMNSRQIGSLVEGLALRTERQRKMVDTLFQVEKAFVPFPDEPPIVYPDAEVWRQLTERRKEK